MPPDDRYPPGPPMARDIDRSARPPPGYSAPYGRVRGRSPSPVGRAGPAPAGRRAPADEARARGLPRRVLSAPTRAAAAAPCAVHQDRSTPPPRSAGQGAGAEWPAAWFGGLRRGWRARRGAGRSTARPGARPPMEYGGPPYERGPPGPPPSRMAYGAESWWYERQRHVSASAIAVKTSAVIYLDDGLAFCLR